MELINYIGTVVQVQEYEDVCWIATLLETSSNHWSTVKFIGDIHTVGTSQEIINTLSGQVKCTYMMISQYSEGDIVVIPTDRIFVKAKQ